ncbi:MAG: hypothetical protein RJA70_2261 [Pseudomonadota bacterium]|jgi:CRP-like cAMP-binding protein
MVASGALDAERLNLLARFGRSLPTGEVVFREGEAADVAFLVHSGRVRIVKKFGAVERSLRVLKGGELFGETALLPGRVREATAITLGACAMIAFDRTTFGELLAQHPDLGVAVAQQLILRAREAEDRVEISMVRDAQSKVVVGLLRTVPLYFTDSGALEHSALRLPLTPLELSAKVGLDVDAVKRTMQKLRENGYVRIVDEQVEIPSLAALRELRGLLDVRDEILGGDSE